MNWRQGLLRLWIAVSTLWILGVGAFAWPIVADEISRHNYFDQFEAMPIECRNARGTAGVDYQMPSANSPLCFYDEAGFRKTYPEDKRDWETIMVSQHAYLSLPYTPPARPWQVASRWSLLAILPPAAVFALGLLGIWVARGFRRT